MRLIISDLRLSPSDLSGFLGCRHRTGLDLAVAAGSLKRPEWTDPMTEALRRRGAEHERAYVESLRTVRLGIVEIDQKQPPDGRVAQTLEAMRSGAEVIVQAALEGDSWLGYADILQRVSTPSALGDWSYEPYDTKLARETRGGTVLQLSVYADLLEGIQQRLPERFWVVTPGDVDGPFVVTPYRYADFAAYVRVVRAQLSTTLALGHDAIQKAHYPEPVEACDVCRWEDRCVKRRRSDDHLSFIAGIGRGHREELTAQGFPTLAAAAVMPMPIAFKPQRGSRDTYKRIREQARVQLEQRTAGQPVHELLLPVVEGKGLARLPAPSPGDLFLDLEGARFAREGGREYLFGLWGRRDDAPTVPPQYDGLWAFTDADERRAFEVTIDRVMRTLDSDGGVHIYHFGHYEPTTFKRLMGRYASRAEQIDELLRGERFVDLHTVVRHGLRAGVESYSIKKLEQFYGFTRAFPLPSVAVHLQAIELALEANAPAAIPDEARAAVAAYNADDCRSTEALRDWLEGLRAELEAQGTSVPRPVAKAGDANDKVGELERCQQAARLRLLEAVPAEASSPDHEQHPRWLLAYLLDWHRREDKSAWWEYHRLRDLPEGDLFDEPQAIAGLEYTERVKEVGHVRTGKPTGSVVDRYRYPAQEVEIGRKGELSMPDDERIGELVAHDRIARTIDIRKGPAKAALHPSAVFQSKVIPTTVQQEALLRFSEDPQATSCGTDLLFRREPRLRTGGDFRSRPNETATVFAVRLATDLDHTTLAIQGPPGSGKTYVGAQMIRALVGAGKRVGVTAVSHKVICNLLETVRKQAIRAGETVSMGRRCRAEDLEDKPENGGLLLFTKDDPAFAALADGSIQVLGGTSWLWSADKASATVDVLFVDEAGQMSLANTLAVSGAANSLVLLGDPQQLEQPQRGTHPDGVGVSALEHVLGRAATMPPDRGLFLPTTWRLHPAICAFTSEVFYEGKLEPKPGLENQRLTGTGVFDGAGLWWVPVEHDGNQNSSMEEVDVVERIVNILLGNASSAEVGQGFSPAWIDEEGTSRPLLPADLLVVAPYNAQVNRLTERVSGRGVRVGTVDKFQGQEAPVVIYSMATSFPEDAPRGMEFLYSLNRLNVAASRARCAAIVVASPRLLEPACRTPRQMQLANALCRYHERASELLRTNASVALIG
jgi:predicted RecB family nuclease